MTSYERNLEKAWRIWISFAAVVFCLWGAKIYQAAQSYIPYPTSYQGTIIAEDTLTLRRTSAVYTQEGTTQYFTELTSNTSGTTLNFTSKDLYILAKRCTIFEVCVKEFNGETFYVFHDIVLSQTRDVTKLATL